MYRRTLSYVWVAIAAVLSLVLVFSPAAASVITQSADDGLLEDVPEPADAIYRSQI